MIQKRRKFTKEFKEQTVRLILEGGKNISQVSEDLGISDSILRRWIKQYESDPESAFPGKGHLSPSEEEFRRLKRENERLREERDILKKALGIFSEPEK